MPRGHILRPSKRVFKPETYGNPTGTDAAVDMPLVNAAIAACQAAGGGELYLRGVYAVSVAAGGTINLGPNRGCGYALKITGDNVRLDGGGTLKLVAKPGGTSKPTILLIGRGLYDIDVEGTPTGTDDAGQAEIIGWANASGAWVDGFVLDGLNFDNSICAADADLQSAANGVVGATLLLSGCRGPVVRNVTMDYAVGVLGGIASHALTQFARIADVTIGKSYAIGMWLDGIYDSLIERVTISNFVSLTATGLQLAANTDYRRVSRRTTVQNCAISKAHKGIVASGGGMDASHLADGNIVQNNTVNVLDDNVTHSCVMVEAPVPSVRGTWHAYGNQVLNNTLNRPASSPSTKGQGVELRGNSATVNSTPVQTKGAYSEVHGNVVSDANRKLSYLVLFGPYSEYNQVTNNSVYGTIKPGTDQSGGTEVGNVSTPNTTL